MSRTACLLTVLVVGCFQNTASISFSNGSKRPEISFSNGLQIAPERKLAFCRIPKVASTLLTSMVRTYLDGLGPPRHIGPHGWDWDTFTTATPENLGIDPRSITKENGWTFAAWIMDPLQRHLSEFYSKCVQHKGTYEDDGAACMGPLVEEPSTLEDRVEAFEQQALHLASHPPTAVRSFDAASQSYHLRCCLAGSPNRSYDFLGVVSPSQACNNVQLKRMLRMAGYNESFAQATADTVFSPESAFLQHTFHSGDHYSDFFRNRSTTEALKSAFAEDMHLYERQVSAQGLETCLHDEEVRLGRRAA